MPRSHQIPPDRVTGADQVTQRLLLIAGNPDRVQLARQQQPHQMLGVPPIGLHAIPACARDLARRRDHALHAALGELARQTVPRRTGLIRHPHRPRQARTEPGRARSITVHRKRLQLSRLGVQDHRDDLRRVHVQADESLSLRHGWFLQYAVVGCRAAATARHELHPTNTVGEPATSTPRAGRTVNPYCLSCRRLAPPRPVSARPPAVAATNRGDPATIDSRSTQHRPKGAARASRCAGLTMTVTTLLVSIGSSPAPQAAATTNRWGPARAGPAPHGTRLRRRTSTPARGRPLTTNGYPDGRIDGGWA